MPGDARRIGHDGLKAQLRTAALPPDPFTLRSTSPFTPSNRPGATSVPIKEVPRDIRFLPCELHIAHQNRAILRRDEQPFFIPRAPPARGTSVRRC